MNKILQSICLAIALSLSGACVAATKLTVTQGQDSCEFDLESGSAVAIDPVTGHITAVVTNLDECMGPPEPPVINNFTRTPASVTPGGSVTFNWTTEHAVSCAAATNSTLPGWSGSKPLQGPQSITINAESGTYSARLRCTNASGDSVTTGPLSVTVDDGGGGGGKHCPDFPEPAGMTQANNGRQTTGAWPPTFCSNCGGTWVGMFDLFFARGNEAWYYQEPNKYHAIQFNTGPLPSTESGYVEFLEPHNHMIGQSIRNGRRFVSISECPGDFHAASLDSGCYRVNSGNGTIRWEGSADSGPFDCTLQPNTTYYLNIVHTNSPEGDPNPTWACTGNNLGTGLRGCGALMTPRGSSYNSNP